MPITVYEVILGVLCEVVSVVEKAVVSGVVTVVEVVESVEHRVKWGRLADRVRVPT